jgi:anthranilate phosphoribosyltransferase
VVAGSAQDISEGMALAAASIDSGTARARLDQLIRFTGVA